MPSSSPLKIFVVIQMPRSQIINSGPANSTINYSLERVTTDGAVDRLEADWNRLSETSEHPNPFMTYGWFRAWSRRRAAENRAGHFVPNVLVLKEGSSVAGIVPLVRRVSLRFGVSVRRLEFVTNHADYNELLLGTNAGELTNAVMRFLSGTASQWDLIDLRDIRDTGGSLDLIRNGLDKAGLPHAILSENPACPYVSVDGNAASLMTRLSGHVRRTLRKRRERAVGEGMRVRIIEHPQDEPDLLQKLLDLESKKHLRSQYPPFIGTYPEVFQSIFNKMGPSGWLYVALLEQGDIPVAFQMGFRCGDKFWDYTKAYDRSFSRVAPGILLLPALLDYCFERGYHEYDFLRGEEEYKMIWSTGLHRRFRLLIWNRSSRSRIRKFLYHDVKYKIYHLLGRHV